MYIQYSMFICDKFRDYLLFQIKIYLNGASVVESTCSNLFQLELDYRNMINDPSNISNIMNYLMVYKRKKNYLMQIYTRKYVEIFSENGWFNFQIPTMANIFMDYFVCYSHFGENIFTCVKWVKSKRTKVLRLCTLLFAFYFLSFIFILFIKLYWVPWIKYQKQTT